MKIIKYFLLILLVLVSLTSIFNTPGVNLFNSFYNLSTQTDKKDLVGWLEVFLKYPPGVYITLNYFLSQFKVDPNIVLFDRQTVWLAVKFLLYTFYLLTYLSLLYLKKTNRKIIKISFLDLSIAYFASISILLSSVGLIFFDILSAPFLILSISYLIQRKVFPATFFYILGLFFNWSLFVLGPIYLFIFLKNKLSFFNKTVIWINFVAIPILVIFILLASNYNNPHFLGSNIFLNPGGFSKLLSLPFEYVFKVGKMDNLGWSVTVLSLIVVVWGIGDLVRSTILSNLKLNKSLVLLPYLIFPAAFALSLFWANSVSYLFLGLFLIIYYYFVIKIKSLAITPLNTIQSILVLYLIGSLFLQDLSTGSAVIIVLISLILYIFNSSKFNFYLLFLLNLLIFINVFSNFGSTGILSVRGEFFNFFQSAFAAFFILFSIWYINLFFRQKSLVNKVSYLKWLVIILMVLLNLSWIPADGSSDHVSWTQYSLASIEQPNPFAAQTLVDQRYPPLSTAILGIFSNGWRYLIGASEDYAIATKISIIFFYVITVVLLIKFSRSLSKEEELPFQDKLFVILTTFAIVIQTQGFADLNIQLVPSLFAAIYFLFKKKYFLSGLLMGITISIKWQPMILLPLFGATIFNLREGFWVSVKRSFVFVLAVLPVPIICWYLVLINPGGKEAFYRSTDYLLHGAPLLSGQALNLNWIVTYIVHIVNPAQFGSLQELDYLNRQIPTDYAPKLFQGYLFLVVWALLVLGYWLREKKDIVSFLAASVMVFFTHHQLNKSAYEKHLFYVPVLMLFLYLIRPTISNKLLLILFDVMTVMNLIFFYGFTGTGAVNRRFFNFDITILFSTFYFIVFLWVLWKYFRDKELFARG